MKLPPAPVDYLLDDPRPVLPREIVGAILAPYGLTLAELNPSSRARNIVHARSACAYVLRQRGSTFRSIARILRCADHKSVMYAVARFDRAATPADWLIVRRYFKQPSVAQLTDLDQDFSEDSPAGFPAHSGSFPQALVALTLPPRREGARPFA